MYDIDELYQEIIIEHNKNPCNFFTMETYTHKAEGYNPLCGDRYMIYVNAHNGIARDISFQGIGCAISKSSTSLMTELCKGKTFKDIELYTNLFHEMLLNGKELTESEKESLGNLLVLNGVKKFPVRLKCATLAWHTMRSMLKGGSSATTE